MIWLQLFPYVATYLFVGAALCRLTKKLELSDDEGVFSLLLFFWPLALGTVVFMCVFSSIIWIFDTLGRLAAGK